MKAILALSAVSALVSYTFAMTVPKIAGLGGVATLEVENKRSLDYFDSYRSIEF